MKNNKNTGSYYTPDFLGRFIINYVIPNFRDRKEISILEPSVGDGSFVKAFNETVLPEEIQHISFTAVEKIGTELAKAELESRNNRKDHTDYRFINEDFLKFQSENDNKFLFIAGNPPYIKKGLLDVTDIEECRIIHEQAKLARPSFKNIWSAFLIKCCELVDDNGILALILPAELLQVKYAAEIRNYLTRKFERTEIFTFDDLLFECKGQDTVLLIGYKKSANKGQYFTNIRKVEELKKRTFHLAANTALSDTATKWTHHMLSADDLNFIHNLRKRLHDIEYYCDTKPGIVSAANKYFIVNENTERSYGLGPYTKPIIQKALFVNGSAEFNDDDYHNLVTEGRPSKLLCFSDNEPTFSAEVIEYLKIGEGLELSSGYKCKKRKNWYVIPNISTVPQGFFFKRSHLYPKLIKNSAQVLVTDSAYKVEVKSGYGIDSLIFSFYNSLTLTFAELTGRYYGGGVLELTPQEFKKLPVPYIVDEDLDFGAYVTSFENKGSIIEILERNDYAILNAALNLSNDEIARIGRIYKCLVDRRLRINHKIKPLNNPVLQDQE